MCEITLDTFHRGWGSFTKSEKLEVLQRTFNLCKLLQLKSTDTSFLFLEAIKYNIVTKGGEGMKRFQHICQKENAQL